MHQLETTDTEVHSSGSESDHLYAILQLGNKADKFLVSMKINGVDVEMELILEQTSLQYNRHYTNTN